MDNSEIFDEALKSLKVAISGASVYFAEHPVFIKSIEDLKTKIDRVFPLMDPVRIGITPHSLILGEEEFKNTKVYEEIINFFHRRKVKTIEIKKGVTISELIGFMTKSKVSPVDILKEGGLSNILKKGGFTYITVRDLDYSQLLKSEGEDCKDIWLYLLKEGLEKKDAGKIENLVDNLKNTSNTVIDELLADKESGAAVNDLLEYLKNNDREKFIECLDGLTGPILENNRALSNEEIGKLQAFFKNLPAGNIAEKLLNGFKKKDSFSQFNIGLFSTIIDSNKHKEVASALADKLEKSQSIKHDPKIIDKIKDLLSTGDKGGVTDIYQYNLSSILDNISSKGTMQFDREHLKDNYFLILMDLFFSASSKLRLGMILDCVIDEVEQSAYDKIFDRTLKFRALLQNKAKQLPVFASLLGKADARVSEFAEKCIFEENPAADFDSYLKSIEKSSLGLDYYLDKIFLENKANFPVLKSFFRFFPGELDSFCENLKNKIEDLPFVADIIKFLNENREEDDSALQIFKSIFSISNDFLKIKILKSMERLEKYDGDFLFSVLDGDSFLHRKCALKALIKYPSERIKAAKLLFDIRNPLGINNRIIMGNLDVVAEVYFPEAEEYLQALTRCRFFWNRTVRNKALSILNHYGRRY